MTLLTELRADLISDEGMVLHAYQDSLGYWTIGIGRLIDKARDGGITEEEAHYLLDNDIRRVSKDLGQRLPAFRLYPEGVRRALLNMAFQMGVGGLLRFRRMLKALDAEDYETAAAEALQSKWASQTPARAARVAKLIGEGR